MKSTEAPFNNPPNLSRRAAIKNAAAGLAGFAAVDSLARGTVAQGGEASQRPTEEQLLAIETAGQAARPLDTVTVRCAGAGTLCVWDGQGREYYRAPARPETKVTVAGALGRHLVLLEDEQGRIVCRATFPVDCQTEIVDAGGVFGDLLGICQHTFVKFMPQMGLYHYRVGGRNYRLYFGWIHDSTHGFKGLRYFEQGFKDNVDLLALWQWPDGMVPNRYRIYAKGRGDNWENARLDPIGHCKRVEGPDNINIRVVRLPVMNDPEYCFIKQLYLAWQTTGDTAWMTGKLDNAIRAVAYATSNEYIWSEKFQLLKRGYTIDGWDYVSDYDKFGAQWANFMTEPGKTVFGVFHGDNTGFAHSLRLLAKMLAAAGREAESQRYAKLADDFIERLDKIAWTGTHYRNHVSEDPSFQRDFGVEEETQVGQSNAFALTRGLSHDKCVEIIRQYQRIRRELPDGCHCEYFHIFPPFEKGFRHKWVYGNGSVNTMCAGDLAYGALEHGFEGYGAQVLKDMHGWGREFGFLPPDVRGNLCHEMPPVVPLDLTTIANVDFHGQGAPGVPGWVGHRDHDLREMPVGRQTFLGVPFDVIDPAKNGRRACVGLSYRKGYATSVRLPVAQKLATLFFLHTMQGSGLAGWFKVHYRDGSTRTEYIHDPGLEKDRGVPLHARIEPWTDPSDPEDKSPNYMDFFAAPEVRPAWVGRNPQTENVGVGLWPWQNPKPELTIDAIEFHAAENQNIWFILALSGTATPATPAPAKISGGYHPLWGAGLVTQALVQGLAGIQDQGVAFDRLRLAPRWLAADVAEATACARYPESDGYARYHYRYDKENGRLRVALAAKAQDVAFELLLPEGKQARAVALDGSDVPLVEKQVEQSRYVCLEIRGVRAHTVEVQLR